MTEDVNRVRATRSYVDPALTRPPSGYYQNPGQRERTIGVVWLYAGPDRVILEGREVDQIVFEGRLNRTTGDYWWCLYAGQDGDVSLLYRIGAATIHALVKRAPAYAPFFTHADPLA